MGYSERGISIVLDGGSFTMSRFTKKYMTEDYERLYGHAGLLELYLWDTQAGVVPDATETQGTKEDRVRVQLWRAKSASGGYVVVSGSTPNVWLLDDAVRMYADNHSEHTLAIRICLERLQIARNRIATAA